VQLTVTVGHLKREEMDSHYTEILDMSTAELAKYSGRAIKDVNTLDVEFKRLKNKEEQS